MTNFFQLFRELPGPVENHGRSLDQVQGLSPELFGFPVKPCHFSRLIASRSTIPVVQALRHASTMCAERRFFHGVLTHF
jgi:hypothetical protein